MEKCKNCYHYDACMRLIVQEHEELICCKNFVDKNKVVCLPADLGKPVWVLAQPCGGCSCYNEPMTEEFIKKCQQCKEWEIGQCDFDYELIPEYGKLVFATKEEAENKLKELMKNEGI